MVVNIIFKKLFNKNLSDEYLNLSIGRVYFKKITNKMVTQIEILSKGNSNVYISLFERAITNLSNNKIDNLFLEDANKLRKKVKEILIENNLLKIKDDEPTEKEADIFSKKDIEWFNKSHQTVSNKLGI